MHDRRADKRRPVPLDFAGVIDLWPSVSAFCEATATPDATARAWKRRGRIPPEHWDAVIAGAEKAGVRGVCLDSLMGALRIAMAREYAQGLGSVSHATKAAMRRGR